MGHLMKDENNFLSFSDFTDRYNIETNFLTFQGVILAVKALWKSNVANLHNGNATLLVFGLKPNENKNINFYFLLARYFIWICRMRSISPKIENFSLFLSHYDIRKTFS